eukprot:856458-Alexandrium_andersonii.AAC.1
MCIRDSARTHTRTRVRTHARKARTHAFDVLGRVSLRPTRETVVEARSEGGAQLQHVQSHPQDRPRR